MGMMESSSKTILGRSKRMSKDRKAEVMKCLENEGEEVNLPRVEDTY